MKQTIFSILLVSTAICAMAEQPVYKWNYLIDTASAQDAASKVILASDGKAITVSHFGSKTSSDKFSYNGEEIATGAATSSTSDNRNLVIMKHDNNGRVVWAVSTNAGYVDSGDGGVTALPDGGVAVLMKVRGSNVGDIVTPVFVDAEGEHTFDNWNTSAAVYNTVLMKISGAGLVEWVRKMDQSQLAVGNVSKDILDAVYPYAITSDSHGNIYVGGNYRTPVMFGGKSGSVYTLSPRSVDSWNGNSQSAAGGFFLVKLDSEGNFSTSLKSEGSTVRDQITGLYYSDGKIYFFGNIQGAEGSALKVGGKEVTLPNTLDHILYGFADENLTVEFAGILKAYPASDGKHTTQAKSICVLDGSIYMVGAVKGGFGASDSSQASIATSGTALEGFAVKCDGTDGSFRSAHIYGSGISSYLGVFKNNNKTYLYGYKMNVNEGVVLHSFEDDDSWKEGETGGKVSIVLGGGAPIAYDCAFDPSHKILYSVSRGNNVFSFPGTEEKSEKPAGFGGLFASYSLDGTSTAVAGPAKETGLKIVTGEGAVVVNTTATTRVEIYDIKGICLYDADVEVGETVIPLKKGVYVVNGEKIMVK